MKTCPKCSFIQPPDQFCAKCGVDMDTYIAPKPAFLKRVFSNPYAQMIIIGAIVFWAIESYLNGKQTLSTEYSPIVNVASELVEAPPQPQIESSKIQPKSQQPTATQSPDSIVRDDSPPIYKRYLQLTYAYMSRDQFSELVRRSSTTYITDTTLKGILSKEGMAATPSAQEISYRPLLTLPKREIKNQADFKFHSLSKKNEGSNEPLGLRIDISPTFTGKRVRLDINIEMNLQESHSTEPQPEMSQAFSSMIEIDSSQKAFLYGILPRKTSPLNESDPFFAQGVFAVMQSEEYLEQQADLVLFLEILEERL